MSSLPPGEPPSLVLRQTGQRYPLTQPVITLGRQAGNTIVLADPPVSRHHARITFHPESGWVLEDLGSANGTLLNGQRLAAPHRLHHGDSIQIGQSILEVRLPRRGEAAYAPPPLYPPADTEDEAEERAGGGLLPLLLIGMVVVLALVVGLTLLLVRGLRSNPAPTVTLLAPANNSQLAAGQQITIQASAQDNQGVTRLELTIDGRLISTATSANPRGDPTLSADLAWSFAVPGSHSISAVAYDARGAASSPAVVVVSVVDGGDLPTATPPPAVTPSPAATPTPTATPPLVVVTATPSDTPPPTDTPTPSPTSTPTPTPTGTPTPTRPPLPKIEYLRVLPATIRAGECARLEWGKVDNATRADIEPGIGGVGTPGNTQVCPLSTTTYILTATGIGGVTTAQVTLFVETAGLPDLTILGVTYDPDPPVVNASVVISVTLKNVGGGAAGPFRWEYQAGAYAPLGGQVNGLAVGATLVVTGTWQPTSPHNNLPTEARVDPDDAVLESNEDNNTFPETIQVIRP